MAPSLSLSFARTAEHMGAHFRDSFSPAVPAIAICRSADEDVPFVLPRRLNGISSRRTDEAEGKRDRRRYRTGFLKASWASERAHARTET